MSPARIPDPKAFIRANTALLAPPLVAELRLYLASEVVPLWRKTEEELEKEGVPPPYWAFAWAGGQALARYVLDHRDVVAAKRVLDFGSGSGLVALAAAKAGAASVLAADIDAFAAAVIELNADANHMRVDITTDDVIGRADDKVIAGKFHKSPIADRLRPRFALHQNAIDIFHIHARWIERASGTPIGC